MKHALVVITTILATTTAAEAEESIEEKTYWKTQQTYVDRSLAEGEKRCGVAFTFTWIDKPKLRAAAEKSGYTPNGICTNLIDAVVMICRAGEDEKAAVAAKFKGFACGYGKPRKLELKGGIVTYLGNNEEANFSDFAKPWLMKKL